MVLFGGSMPGILLLFISTFLWHSFVKAADPGTDCGILGQREYVAIIFSELDLFEKISLSQTAKEAHQAALFAMRGQDDCKVLTLGCDEVSINKLGFRDQTQLTAARQGF